jgi:ATP-dependent Lhr-like helicase
MAPPWRVRLRSYRRAEARGEVRGGRFLAEFVGEQFALPEAVEALRALRKQEPDVDDLGLSVCDPLNVVGILTPGPRVTAVLSNEARFRSGVPVEADAGQEADPTPQAGVLVESGR